ncbi:hypothetical protein [Brevundimonas sp.]|uniref:hypothetical protein n=1 Tax=Brevundimonas sp. TaxID=1871086 RepID=UPI0028ACF1E4|nr:hypothetical protein [Brevundimonas sp.]
MTIAVRRRLVSNLKLSEISSVDHPAQAGATVVLMKRAEGGDVEIRKNATAVAGGGAPAFGVADYEHAMLRRADELAMSQRVTPEQALAKNLSTDRSLMDLAHASQIARCSAYAVEVRKRYGERAS